MLYIFRIIKSWFCEHFYGDGTHCPFTDEEDNHCAVYTCEKCGKRKLVKFSK